MELNNIGIPVLVRLFFGSALWKVVYHRFPSTGKRFIVTVSSLRYREAAIYFAQVPIKLFHTALRFYLRKGRSMLRFHAEYQSTTTQVRVLIVITNALPGCVNLHRVSISNRYLTSLFIQHIPATNFFRCLSGLTKAATIPLAMRTCEF